MVIKQKTQTLILAICLLFFTTTSAYAASADFSWSASSTAISGYKIHYGTSSRNYNAVIDVGLPKPVDGRILASVTGLQEGQTYYFAATAYSTGGESGYSVEIKHTIPGAAGSVPSDASSTVSSSLPDNETSNLSAAPTDPSYPVSGPAADIHDFAFELGELQVTSDWQHVEFSTEFTSPSVVAKATTINDPEPGFAALRNVTSEGFDIRISEWNDIDGLHQEETVTYMAMDRGHHQIADNVYAVAECIPLAGLNTFQPVTFTNSLTSQPVVLSSIITSNDPKPASLKTKDITSQGFSIAMQEQEDNDGKHAEESVCFIAIEKWSGVVDNLIIEVGTTEEALTDTAATMFFEQQFPTIPLVLADMQSSNDIDTAILGISDLSATDMTMTVVEEQSRDSEVRHTPEIAGYFAVSPVNPGAGRDSLNSGAALLPAAPKQLNAKTMTSLISLFNDLIQKTER